MLLSVNRIFFPFVKTVILKLSKWLVDLDIHADNECAFQLVYQYDHLKIAKWLFGLGIDLSSI